MGDTAATDSYRVLLSGGEGEIVEKKSRFIATIRKCETEEEAVAFIEEMKKKYWDARHNCSAFIIGSRGELTRCSDDGEPSGTAGRPMLEVLTGSGIRNIAVVVTRYFGGVLLGAGGLVRAYTKGAKDAVDAAQIKCMAEAVKLAVTVDYGLYGRLAQVFADFDARVEDERFADNVRIVLHIRAENSQKLTDKLVDVCNGAVSVEEIEKLNFDFA